MHSSADVMSHIEDKQSTDKAEQIVLESSAIDTSLGDYRKEEKRLLRKMDVRVVPILAVLYLLSFLDRGASMYIRGHTIIFLGLLIDKYTGSIGNANIQGLSTDLKLVGNQYNL